MTLIITAFAAIICILLWYICPKARKLKIGTLCLIYSGAALMWAVDAVTEYCTYGAAFFSYETDSISSDTILGFSVTILGLLIWLIYVLISDPQRVVSAAITQNNREENKQ